MKSINIHPMLIQSYLALLNNLSHNDKLEIISKHSQSMKSSQQETSTLNSLFGAFVSEDTADEQISKIIESRTFQRKIEEF